MTFVSTGPGEGLPAFPGRLPLIYEMLASLFVSMTQALKQARYSTGKRFSEGYADGELLTL
jgi:hypothetical protein